MKELKADDPTGLIKKMPSTENISKTWALEVSKKEQVRFSDGPHAYMSLWSCLNHNLFFQIRIGPEKD